MSSETKNEALAIDVPLTWRGSLSIFLLALVGGTEEGKRLARKELARMAEAADRWNAHCEAQDRKD